MADFGNVDEWILELENLAKGYNESDGYMTAREMSEQLNIGIERVHASLRKLKADGRLEVVNQYRENLAGRRHYTPAYKVIPGKSSDQRKKQTGRRK